MKLLLPASFLVLTLCCFGQGNPLLTAKPQTNSPTIYLATQDNVALKNKELDSRKVGRPDHFAKAVVVNYSPDSQGEWNYLSNDQANWHIRIGSKDAYSLNLGFDRFHLTENAQLYVYTPDLQHIYGPFSSQDNESHGQLWTPALPGEEIIIELQIPISEIQDIDLNLKYVNHDFMNIYQKLASGICNIDVICGAENGFPLIDQYRDIINSVGAYTLSGVLTCSGALINNSRNDCTPYFLTADHCGISPANAASIVSYWNYQNSTCRIPGSIESGNNGNGSKAQFNSGAKLIANYSSSDFALIEFDDPIDPSFKPYFAGWDRSGISPDTSICIHHPGVEEKRISFDFNKTVPQPNNIDSTHIRVLDWDLGTTEGGSSGSSIFTPDGLIYGQLTGGFASCNNESYDDFGRLAKSWIGGGSPQSRLMDWLDPDGLGMITLAGHNCTFSIAAQENGFRFCKGEMDSLEIILTLGAGFQDTVDLVANQFPAGINLELENEKLAPKSSTKLIISNLSLLSGGVYTIPVIASNEANSTFTNIVFTIIPGAPIAPIGISPSDNEIDVSTFAGFTWDGAGDSFGFQLSTNENFDSPIVDDSALLEPHFSPLILEMNQTYFWRARSTNICGTSTWSPTYSFTTFDLSCLEYTANDTPIAITAAISSTITSELSIVNGGEIIDVNVIGISGEHTWINDLIFTLTSPSGTKVTLLADKCDGEDDFDISFDDESLSENIPCPFNDGDSYRPQDSMSIFAGENARGVWKLDVTDAFPQDGGFLGSWGLVLCLDQSVDYGLFMPNRSFKICDIDSIKERVTIGKSYINPEIILEGNLAGLNYRFEAIPESDNGQRFDLIISGLKNLIPDEYTYNVIVKDQTRTDTLSLSITREGAKTPPRLLKPANNLVDVSLQPGFTWVSSGSIIEYHLEIASDSLFENLIVSTTFNSLSYQIIADLAQLTTYYWRVSNRDMCGIKLTSELFRFTTKFVSPTVDLEYLGMRVFPNPATDLLHFEINDDALSTGQITLYDQLGRLVLIKDIPNRTKNMDIPVGNLVDGLYMLKVAVGENVAATKLLIAH